MAIEVRDTFYTLDEAARKMGVCYMTIYRKVRKGQVRTVRAGRSYLVRLEDLPAPKSIKR